MLGLHRGRLVLGSAALVASIGGAFSVFAQAPDSSAYATASVPPQQVVQQQHPLAPAIEMATKVKQNLDTNVRDYSATIEKRELIDGKLGDPEYALLKVRQHPFSVYMCFLSPEKLKGQECMYIEGQNDDKMFAHAPPGTLRGKFGTVKISPTSAPAMQGQRYPITEMGITNLTRKLIEVGQHDMKFGECDVKFFQKAKVNGRECTVIQVTHPVPRRNFLFNIARIYVDDELQVPIRYEAYDWPTAEGGKPVLLEEYTYMNLKLNPGLTDADFDVRNPAYNFNVK